MVNISAWDIQQAEKVIIRPTDGSKSNKAARERAAKLLRNHAAHLVAFASVNPGTQVFDSVMDQVSCLMGYVEAVENA